MGSAKLGAFYHLCTRICILDACSPLPLLLILLLNSSPLSSPQTTYPLLTPSLPFSPLVSTLPLPSYMS